jgi:hypothetical protein
MTPDDEREYAPRLLSKVFWDYAMITAMSIALLVLAAGMFGLACGVFMRAYYFMAGEP